MKRIMTKANRVQSVKARFCRDIAPRERYKWPRPLSPHPRGAPPMEQAFLDSIRESTEDAPRLVYADWLDEQGSPEQCDRAEFVRTGCRLTALPPGSARREQLLERLDDLLARNEEEWLAPLPWDLYRW